MLNKIKKIWSVVSAVLVALVAIGAIFLVGTRLLGIQAFSITSGSMEPQYPVGSLICVKDVEPSEVEVGDVITYVTSNKTPVTHRVTGIDSEREHFYTKGDANASADLSPVRFRNVIGAPILMIPYLGYVIHYAQNPPGSYVMIIATIFLLASAFLPDLLKKKD